jgi:hypothetical protein
LFLIVLLSFIFFLGSCDILRNSLFEVTSWTPGSGYHGDPEQIAVSLNFSREPDRQSVERNFSLSGNGSRVRGVFLWNGKSVTFAPLAPFEKNTDYVISLSADANDTGGLSMDETFIAGFTTRPDNARPVLISCSPSGYEEVAEARAEISLLFSLPVPLGTLYENVSFNPSMTGFWRLCDEGELAVFTPSEPWASGTRYEIRVSSSLADINGMNTGSEFFSVFTAGTDREAPYLLSARRMAKDGGITELLEPPFINRGWEKDDSLSLVFSKPADALSVKNYITAEDARPLAASQPSTAVPSLVMETSFSPETSNTEFIFKFDGVPVFESFFTVRVKPGIKDLSGNESKNEYVYIICADGQYSKPPVLAGMRVPMSPDSMSPDSMSDDNMSDDGGDGLNLVVISADSVFEIIPVTDADYPSGAGVNTWIELYFDAAPGASIDPFSLMGLFRIETSNNVLNFSPRRIRTENFTVSAPHGGWEDYQRIEIGGILTNSTNFGLVYLQIGAGLADSLGNKNEKTQKITFIK